MLFKTRGLNSITRGKCVRGEEGLGWKATKTPVLQTQPRLPFRPSHTEGVCVPPRASEWASECSDQVPDVRGSTTEASTWITGPLTRAAPRRQGHTEALSSQNQWHPPSGLPCVTPDQPGPGRPAPLSAERPPYAPPGSQESPS